jgi:hypothetical protein
MQSRPLQFLSVSISLIHPQQHPLPWLRYLHFNHKPILSLDLVKFATRASNLPKMAQQPAHQQGLPRSAQITLPPLYAGRRVQMRIARNPHSAKPMLHLEGDHVEVFRVQALDAENEGGGAFHERATLCPDLAIDQKEGLERRWEEEPDRFLLAARLVPKTLAPFVALRAAFCFEVFATDSESVDHHPDFCR